LIMKHFYLIRRFETKNATSGIFFDEKFFAYSLEKNWDDNKPFESCIPEGEYIVHPDNTGKHKFFKVADVSQRTDIEIHPANHPEELSGCIALGVFPFLDEPSYRALGDSREAMNYLYAYQYNKETKEYESFKLTIKNKENL